MTQMKVFVGWDSREDIAYQVSKFSALQQSKNVNVFPLRLDVTNQRSIKN